MWYIVVAVLSVLAGGYGGYELGAKAERKGQLLAGAAKQAAAGVATAADAAVQTVKKAL
jgi:hypothetical protein